MIRTTEGITMKRLIRLHGAAGVLFSRPEVAFEDFVAPMDHPKAAELVASWKAFVEAKEAHEALIASIDEELWK